MTTEAEDVLSCASAIMKGMGAKSIAYIGEWNTILMYLEKRVREEKDQ